MTHMSHCLNCVKTFDLQKQSSICPHEEIDLRIPEKGLYKVSRTTTNTVSAIIKARDKEDAIRKFTRATYLNDHPTHVEVKQIVEEVKNV